MVITHRNDAIIFNLKSLQTWLCKVEFIYAFDFEMAWKKNRFDDVQLHHCDAMIAIQIVTVVVRDSMHTLRLCPSLSLAAWTCTHVVSFNYIVPYVFFSLLLFSPHLTQKKAIGSGWHIARLSIIVNVILILL